MFGDRVADMVGADSNPPHREGDTWYSRKQEAIDRLAAASRDAQMVAMGDKLSNLRSIANDYKKHGDDLWKRFKAPKGKADLAWYYSGLAKALSPLASTAAHKEFVDLLEKTFINTKA
jgi:myo-inositol-1(or 4)-monophosphatase